jgi:hypothetical protein
MSRLPVTPKFKLYRGSKEKLRRQAAAHNAMAQRVADHVNTLAANNPDEVQQYLFATIADDLGLTTDQVRSAISTGGHNGITFGVRDAERAALANCKRASNFRSD